MICMFLQLQLSVVGLGVLVVMNRPHPRLACRFHIQVVSLPAFAVIAYELGIVSTGELVNPDFRDADRRGILDHFWGVMFAAVTISVLVFMFRILRSYVVDRTLTVTSTASVRIFPQV